MVVWKDDKRVLRAHECLTILAMYRAYKRAGDNYRESVDLNKLPYISRADIIGTTPNAVWEEMTEIYRNLIRDINSLFKVDDTDGIREHLESGNYNPLEKLISDPMMVDAIGNFLFRKYNIVKRMSEDEAIEQARDNISKAKMTMRSFIGTTMSDAVKRIEQASIEAHLDVERGDLAALRPRVIGFDYFQGLNVQFDLDGKVMMLNDETNPVRGDASGQESMYV